MSDGTADRAEPQQPDIARRTLNYALRAIRLYQALQQRGDAPGWEIGKQYFRAAASIGANVAEAQAAESRADFAHKMNIALKEAHESAYWLQLLVLSGVLPPAQLTDIKAETDEIRAIVGAIVAKARGARKETN